MNTALHQKQNDAARLTDAFELFNQLSKNLSNSYQSLETQVSLLNQELAAVRSERMQTLIEKERIASRLQQLLVALPAGVIVLDEQESIIDCNQLAIDYLGEPLLHQQWHEIMQRSLFPVINCVDERQLKDGRRINIKRNVLSEDGGQIVLLSDVSELRHLQDLLAQQKHLSAMGEMVAGMAHQVRTPLSTALLYASQMDKCSVDEGKRQQFSKKILERLHHLERQVNDMLIFAKQGKLLMSEFSLALLLQHIQENMQNQSVNFSIINGVTEDSLHGNMDALLGALMNILDNAVQACDEQATITMQITQHQPGQLKIEIIDNGCGISLDQQKRLFEPFFTTKGNGTGLGLAVVESVVVAHHGQVTCHSVVKEGTRFTLILPCIKQHTIGVSPSNNNILREVSDYEIV